RKVMPAAIAMGILWEVSKYAYMKALPWLDFPEVYGPFSISVTLMFWAFLSGMMLLAGARLASAEPLPVDSPNPAEHATVEPAWRLCLDWKSQNPWPRSMRGAINVLHRSVLVHFLLMPL